MSKNMKHEIAVKAMEAMLYEVSATPKPGLVDRNNCGAHRDMDYFTFMSSAAALHSCFDAMVQIGIAYREQEIGKLLPALRECGIKEEEKMFQVTHGVNTHKGMIFTLGLLCGCAGWQLGKEKYSSETLCLLVGKMCEGLCGREYSGIGNKHNLTKGERMYLRYGCYGVRGEAESGYRTIRTVSMPVYSEMMKKGIAVNDVLVQTLLYLIAQTTDTNILSRHDRETAEYARKYAEDVIAKGGIFTDTGRLALVKMDEDFNQRLISPGGCADLLAATYFLHSLSGVL